jgi:pimeloyl-ACP methyl ester carboxylesterase
MAALEPRFKEQAVLLGSRGSLVAIITRPLDSTRSEEPAVVILNTGIIHRVGHHRMYVTLSRILAGAGRTVVRFDFSGIGDSAPRSDGLTPLLSCLRDIKEVLDSLEQLRLASRFVLVGLCSGADHAVLYGHTDPRIVGLVLMDPTLPRTARYYLHYIVQRLGNLRNWLSVLSGRSGLLRLATEHVVNRVRPQGTLQGLMLENLPFSPYLGMCYRATAARGQRILLVLTSISTRHTYAKQWLDAFPEVGSSGAARAELFGKSDHLFSAARDRQRLFQVITDWLGSG